MQVALQDHYRATLQRQSRTVASGIMLVRCPKTFAHGGLVVELRLTCHLSVIVSELLADDGQQNRAALTS